jgi:leucyl-tRNA synthetase
VLSCFAPHLAEELWHKYLSMDSFIINDKWPTFDNSKLNKTTITIPIQENGKLRDTIVVPINIDEQDLINEIKKLPKVINFINNRPIKKIIYITNKIVNIII